MSGAPLSARPVGSVGQTVIDVEIRVAKIETTKQRRWCSACKTIHTARSPIALPNSRFTVRTDVLLAALKVNGVAYARSRALASSFLGIRIDENDMVRAMHRVAKALGPLYEEFARQIRTASAVNVDETRWWVSGEGAWLWDFVTRWTVLLVAETSRSGEVPRRHLEGFKGTVGKDSFGATNGIGSAEQVCLQHYLREIGRTLDLKNPGDEFRRRMAPTLIRIIGDGRRADKYKSKKRRLECKKRLEARVGRMARADWTEPNCRRFAKRLRRERGKMFTFLAVDEIKWHNNDAERPFRPSASIRKVSGGSRSMEGARDHAVLQSINQTCRARKMDFCGSVVRHLAVTILVFEVAFLDLDQIWTHSGCLLERRARPESLLAPKGFCGARLQRGGRDPSAARCGLKPANSMLVRLQKLFGANAAAVAPVEQPTEGAAARSSTALAPAGPSGNALPRLCAAALCAAALWDNA